MANVGDVLLPIAGGILGTNPYLGSGIRTALTVDQALGRRKWQDSERQRKQDEKDAEKETAEAEAEKKRLLTGNFKAMVETWGKENDEQQKASTLMLMADRYPDRASKEFFDLVNQKKEEAGWTSERFGTVAGDMREANPSGSFGISGRLEGGGSAQMQYPAPTVAESLQHDFGWKGVNKDTPWIKIGTKEDGTPAVFIDEELKAAMAPYRSAEKASKDEETEAKIMAAQIKVEKTKGALDKYTRDAIDKMAAAGEPGDPDARAPSGYSNPGERHPIYDEPKYRQLLLEVRQAEAELTRAAKTAESEVSEDSTGAIYEDYDAEGNPIGGF
jgi:hypothetical protein